MKHVSTRAVVAAVVASTSLSGSVVAGTNEVDGKVKSGGHPIVGATVTLYSAGPDTGSGAVALGAAQSGGGGNFSISYTPPAGAHPVLYLVADGPQVGIRLATVLGTAPFADRARINEKTTVATAYTMAQFIDGAQIGGVFPGPQNAAALLGNLVRIKTGGTARFLRTPPNGNQTSTLRTFHSLANMLAACVNGHLDCALLFALATPPDGPVPTDTLQAAVNIAHHPWQNAVDLFMLSLVHEQYRPARQLPPVTWTLALKYVGNGHEFDGPGAVAFDGLGNVWANQNYVFRNNHSVQSCGSKIVSKLTPAGVGFPGAPYTGGGVDGAGFGISIDHHGDVWIGNFGFFGSSCPCDQRPLANSVSKFNSDGVPLSPPEGFTQGCVTAPQAVVPDHAGNVWIANQCGGTVTLYRKGCPDDHWVYDITNERLLDRNASCPDFSGEGPKPFAIAIDADGDAWVSNNAGANADATVIQLSSKGRLLTTLTVDDGINRPMGVSVDQGGNVWVSNSAIVSLPCADCDRPQDYGPLTPSDEAFPSIGKYESDGTHVDNYMGGGLFIPWGNAVDGAGNVWVANFGGFRVSHFDGETGDPIAPDGYFSDALQRNTGVSIDPSGNVWLTNNWLTDVPLTNPGGDGLVVFIGLAAPTKTPLIGPPQRP